LRFLVAAGHNNQQLGFANSVEGVIEGIEMVDGSYLGMGRGSGNTCLEQLLCFFKNPNFDVRPVMQVQPPPPPSY